MIDRRQRLAIVASVLAVACTVVLVDRFVLSAEWWQVDHRSGGAPAAPLADIGPPPGALATGWQHTAEVHRGRLPAHDRVAHALVRDQLLVASGRGLQLRDGRTGAERWHYFRRDWTLLGWAATGDHVIAYLERMGGRRDSMMIGFDAGTGRLRWRRSGAAPAAIAGTTLRWPAGAGVVLGTTDDRAALQGRSAGTGEVRWSAPLPQGCRAPASGRYASDGDAQMSVLVLDCGVEPAGTGSARPRRMYRIIAVDPSTGRTRWSRAATAPGMPEVAVRGGHAAVADDTALRVYDEGGRELAGWPGEDVCGDEMCPVEVAGGRFIAVHRPGDFAARRMTAIDLESGRTVWRHDGPGPVALATAGGTLFALRGRLAGELLPAGVDTLDPVTGAGGTVPVPIAVNAGLDGTRPWLAAAGGLLYAAVAEAVPRPKGAARVVALRGAPPGPGPAELGGVAVTDWPDACALLGKADLAAAGLRDHTVRRRNAAIGPVRLPRPVICTYHEAGTASADGTGGRGGGGGRGGAAGGDGTDGRDGRDGTAGGLEKAAEPAMPRGFSVTVKWVAHSDAAAGRLLEALCATQAQARRRTDLGADDACEIGPTAGTIVLRVDRRIIAVSATRPPAAAARLARAVTAAVRTEPTSRA